MSWLSNLFKKKAVVETTAPVVEEAPVVVEQPAAVDDHTAQDEAFLEGVGLTDDELAAELEKTAYISEDGVFGRDSFEGWDRVL